VRGRVISEMLCIGGMRQEKIEHAKELQPHGKHSLFHGSQLLGAMLQELMRIAAPLLRGGVYRGQDLGWRVRVQVGHDIMLNPTHVPAVG